jgi:hypothetical protein
VGTDDGTSCFQDYQQRWMFRDAVEMVTDDYLVIFPRVRLAERLPTI